jgi:Ca-activated chloride channel family protein
MVAPERARRRRVGMIPPGRPKGEHGRALPEGTPVNAHGSRTLIAALLQMAALAALALALLGQSWLDPRLRPRWLLLVDRSASVPSAVSDPAVGAVERAARSTGAEIQRLDFAGRPGPPTAAADTDAAALDPSATDIEAALQAALALHARSGFDRIVVVSDGLANGGDTERGLRAVHEAGVMLQWIAVGRSPPPTRLADVLAPDHARVGQRVQVSFRLAGRLDRPLRVEAHARMPDGDVQAVMGDTDGSGQVTVEFDARSAGALVIDAVLRDPASGETLDAMADAAVVDLAPQGAILYVRGSGSADPPLARSLLGGGWSLKVVSASRIDAEAESLAAYQAVVLDDVAIADADPRFWQLLVTAVRDRGVGLLVLGGERSFAQGGYRGSGLESVLPVSSEPAALDLPASVVFTVDKSGSMGRGSGGVDRFQLAQRGVIESARALTGRDRVGLLVFDVAPRILIPLGPAPTALPALQRDWPVGPGGGTRLEPALNAAIDQLERSGAGRRMLVLVTDGFVDQAPGARLRARLEKAHIETIAIAVGPDADAAALERVVGNGAGTVLRVDQAAELPAAMRNGIERLRARIERGAIGVRQPQPLPFAPATFRDWPAVAALAVTRAKPEATVALQSARADPLLVYRNAGRGRVIALTSGLGPWTPRWLSWREWPRLAGGLADWVSGASRAGAAAWSVSDRPESLEIAADLVDGARGLDRDRVSVSARTPANPHLSLAAEPVAPGRWRALLPDQGAGLYTFVLSAPGIGTQRYLHLRRHRAENDSWGTSSELVRWKSAGWVEDWDPLAKATRRHGSTEHDRPLDRSLVGLALALFVAGVLVDRLRLGGFGRLGRRGLEARTGG